MYALLRRMVEYKNTEIEAILYFYNKNDGCCVVSKSAFIFIFFHPNDICSHTFCKSAICVPIRQENASLAFSDFIIMTEAVESILCAEESQADT